MNLDFKVTIGICVKNAEGTIKEAISSVLVQSFPHELMELIVVDGYSKDKTLNIIDSSLENIGIKRKVFYENEGLGHARQMVVDNSEGKYIVWVDGDMVLSDEYVGKLVAFMEQNPKVGIAKGKYGTLEENSLVAALENIEFVSSFNSDKQTDSAVLATSGSIYRIEAIRQVNGFDVNIKGVGEDMDAEYRVRSAGWLLRIVPTFFYERRRKTWGSLWNEYFWHGKGGHDLVEKNWQIVNLYKMLPPVALGTELLRVATAYRLTRQKISFLLPLHYTFKRTAWFLGFLKSWFEKNS